jgi:hypothetical protein
MDLAFEAEVASPEGGTSGRCIRTGGRGPREGTISFWAACLLPLRIGTRDPESGRSPGGTRNVSMTAGLTSVSQSGDASDLARMDAFNRRRSL